MLLQRIIKYSIILCLTAFYGCALDFWSKDKEPREFTITFHKNDGSGETVTQVVRENATVTLMPNEFARGGYKFGSYEFVGWRGSWLVMHVINGNEIFLWRTYHFEDEGKFQSANIDWDANSNLGILNIDLHARWEYRPEPLFEPLSEEKKLRIRQDYLNTFIIEKFPDAKIEHVHIKTHYGSFYNSIVVSMDSKYLVYDDTEREMIFFMWEDQQLIRYSDFDRLWLWNDGKFYKLPMMCMLSSTFIPSDTPDWNKCENLSNRRRILNRLNGLSIEMASLLEESIGNNSPAAHLWDTLRYYGTYNDSAVFSAVQPDPYSIFVGGQVFILGSGIYVFQEGKIYTLREAYNSGLLDEEDIRDIAYYDNFGVIDIHRIIRDDGYFFHYRSFRFLWLKPNELKEAHASGLFREVALRSIAERNGWDFDDLVGGEK